MRIGMICPYSFDVAGGVQAHVVDLARVLIERRGKSPIALRVRLVDGSGFDVTEAGTKKSLAAYLVRDVQAVPGIASLGPDPLADDFTREAFGELFAAQGHLGAMPATVDDALWDLPASRHEAACASGGVAIVAAIADLCAGNYDSALVLGVEIERTVPGDTAARHLGTAAWTGHEGADARFIWPYMFSAIADEYDRETPDVEDLGGGRYRVQASMDIDDLAERFGVDIEEDDVDTVGGLIGKTIGRVPILGSHCVVGGLSMTAERMSGRRHRIATVVVERVGTSADETEGGAA